MLQQAAARRCLSARSKARRQNRPGRIYSCRKSSPRPDSWAGVRRRALPESREGCAARDHRERGPKTTLFWQGSGSPRPPRSWLVRLPGRAPGRASGVRRSAASRRVSSTIAMESSLTFRFKGTSLAAISLPASTRADSVCTSTRTARRATLVRASSSSRSDTTVS
jgi:hypothetical protein